MVLGVLCVSIVLVGCSDSGGEKGASGSSSNLSGLNLEAEVDPETAVVTLPADYVALGEQVDSSTLSSAYLAAIAECSRMDLGVPWTAEMPDPYMPTRHMWTRYGPWTKPVAEKFAFVLPMGDGGLIVNGFVEEPEGHEWVPDPNEALTEAQREEIFAACIPTPEVQKFNEENLWTKTPGYQALDDEYDVVNRDPRMQDLFSELRVCYAEQGMEMDEESPGYIHPRIDRIDEEQISLALKTVECKDQVNFTRRAADITAERQIPIIEEYADELLAGREKWDDTVAEAESYIAAHPELFEPPK